MWLNNFKVGLFQISEHLNVLVENCGRVHHFMSRGVIRPMEDIAKFLQWKKVILYTIEDCWKWAISFRSPIHKIHMRNFPTSVTMHTAENARGEWCFRSATFVCHLPNLVHLPLRQRCISGATFLYEICLFKYSVPAFTFLYIPYNSCYRLIHENKR